MEFTLYQIDAFANNVFEGNPAAVSSLDEWLDDEIMQSVAAENNLSETAFFVKLDGRFHIRWFTPKGEVDLCGHATLAAAFVLFNILEYKEDNIEFDSRSGVLTVIKNGDWIIMDFPSQPPVACDTPIHILNAFKASVITCLKSEDYIVVLDSETDVKSVKPDYGELEKLDLRGVIVTSTSSDYDFVARVFAPKYGVLEDPVTGSAYTQLAPYWSSLLGSKKFSVKQISSRGGELFCEVVNDRVLISGKAVEYMEGKIKI